MDNKRSHLQRDKSFTPRRDKKEQSKKPSSVLSLLRDFELALIAKFLSPSDKVLKMGLLSKRYYTLVRKHYSWVRFPKPGPFSLFSDLMRFFDSFTELTGLEIPYFKPEYLTENRIERISTEASSVSLTISREWEFRRVCQYPLLLSKLKELTVHFSERIQQ